MSDIEKLINPAIDATAAGHIAGAVIGAVAEHDPGGLDAALEALNTDLAAHDREVVPMRSLTAEPTAKYLRAERIAHLLNMDGFFRVTLQSENAVKVVSALIDRESRLPPRQPGDNNYAPPYDGTDASIEIIRAKDRD